MISPGSPMLIKLAEAADTKGNAFLRNDFRIS